jgi:4-hydroxymandelate oxidase
MTGRKGSPGTSGQESRRRFFKLLAGSPLLALAYPALPRSWQQEVAVEAQRLAAKAPRPSGIPCPDCGQEMVFPRPARSHAHAAQSTDAAEQDPNRFIEGQLAGQMVSTPEEAVNVWDMEAVAHANNLPEHWAYLHMGVDDFETRVANREGFQRLMLRPRRLGPDVSKLDTSVELYGKRYDTPLFLCPVASLEAYHTEGEAGAGRAARERGVLQMQSHQSSQSYDTIAEARGEPHWFQIYTVPDWNVNKRVIDRVASAGCPVLVWTVDLLGGSNRELSRRSLTGDGYEGALCLNCHNHKPGYLRPMRAGLEGPPGPRYPYTWDYIKRLKDASPMKVVVKGIVTREEAELAIENGADGIFVSNHGGRAENSLRSTIDSLPEVVEGVRGRVPVMIDSGVRRGSDIFKALALGADAVGIGRPYVWGLGAFGQEGVDRVLEMLHDEFRMTMRQTLTASLDQIGSDFVMERRTPIMTRSNRLGFGL